MSQIRISLEPESCKSKQNHVATKFLQGARVCSCYFDITCGQISQKRRRVGILMVFELPASDAMRRACTLSPLLFSYTTIYFLSPALGVCGAYHAFLSRLVISRPLDLTAWKPNITCCSGWLIGKLRVRYYFPNTKSISIQASGAQHTPHVPRINPIMDLSAVL